MSHASEALRILDPSKSECPYCGKRMRNPGAVAVREHMKEKHWTEYLARYKPESEPEEFYADYDFPCGY